MVSPPLSLNAVALLKQSLLIMSLNLYHSVTSLESIPLPEYNISRTLKR